MSSLFTSEPSLRGEDLEFRELCALDDVRAWLELALQRRGMSARGVARALDVGAGTVTNYLRGKRGLGPENRARLVALLGLPPWSARALRDHMDAAQGEASAEQQGRIARLRALGSASALTPEAQELMCDLDRAIVWELSQVPGFERSGAWLSTAMGGPGLTGLDPTRAEQLLAQQDALKVTPPPFGVAPAPPPSLLASAHVRERRSLRELTWHQRSEWLQVAAVHHNLMPQVKQALYRPLLHALALSQQLTPGSELPSRVVCVVVQLAAVSDLLEAPSGPLPEPVLLAWNAESSGPVELWESTDYRTFLRGWAQRRQLSQEQIARMLERAVPEDPVGRAQIGHILSGIRHVAPEHSAAWARMLKLDKEESGLFQTLVELGNTDDEQRKEQLWLRVLHLRRFRNPARLQEKAMARICHWRYTVVSELCMLPGLPQDPEWQAGRLQGRMSVEQVQEAQALLLELEEMQRDSTGRLRRAVGVDTNTPRLTRESMAALLDSWDAELLRTLADLDPEHSTLGVLITRIPEAGLPSLLAESMDAREELMRVVDNALIGLDGDEALGIEPVPARAPDRLILQSCYVIPLSRTTEPPDP